MPHSSELKGEWEVLSRKAHLNSGSFAPKGCLLSPRACFRGNLTEKLENYKTCRETGTITHPPPQPAALNYEINHHYFRPESCVGDWSDRHPVKHIGKKKYINPMKTVEKEVILALEGTSVI
ncbi:hypothetical protein H8959_017506 [Pygathrix nigripes]